MGSLSQTLAHSLTELTPPCLLLRIPAPPLRTRWRNKGGETIPLSIHFTALQVTGSRGQCQDQRAMELWRRAHSQAKRWEPGKEKGPCEASRCQSRQRWDRAALRHWSRSLLGVPRPSEPPPRGVVQADVYLAHREHTLQQGGNSDTGLPR